MESEEDRIFGFYEPPYPGTDSQFWRDHEKAWRVCHSFVLVNADSIKRMPHDTFAGVAQIRERVKVPVTWDVYDTMYEVYHDVWCVGVDHYVCGTHGADCPAIDVVARWCEAGTRITELVYWPAMTWDGRLFLVGVQRTDSAKDYALKFE